MRDHFVIDKFILFRQHHISIQSQKLPKFRRIEDIDPLKLALSAVKLAIHPDGNFTFGV